MRLLHHLNEMATELSIQEVLEFNYNSCQPFLKQIIKKGSPPPFMFSGRTHNAKTFTRRVQTDRQPLDTPPTVHKVLDLKFQRAWGFKARSQSIFCTGSPTHASLYGHPFMIFPMGNFKFLYHQKVKDMFNHIRFNITFDLDTSSLEDFDKFEERVVKFIDEYKNKDIVAGIKSGNEIMVHCKEYFAVSDIYQHLLHNWYRKHGNVKPTEENILQIFDPADVMNGTGLRVLKK